MDDIPYYDIDDDNYNDLILNHDHHKKGESSKGKFISYHENLALVNQTLNDVIQESYHGKLGWTDDEYDIRVGILIDVQKYPYWFNASPYIQL